MTNAEDSKRHLLVILRAVSGGAVLVLAAASVTTAADSPATARADTSRAAGRSTAEPLNQPPPNDRFLYLPPAWADRVVFYHSFEHGVEQPEINTAGLTIQGEKTATADGFVGSGYHAASLYEKHAVLTISGAAVAVNKPLTVMKWYRLDAPMKPETCFQLFSLQGHGGYIANFVRGKGEWCALQEPTYVSQIYNLPGIPHYNNIWGGRVWFEPGEWHHVAMTFAGGSEVCIYWDGVLRETIGLKGRVFDKDDVTAIQLDPGWLYFPMTIDEVILVDRALSRDEIGAYVRATFGMKQNGYPLLAPQSVGRSDRSKAKDRESN